MFHVPVMMMMRMIQPINMMIMTVGCVQVSSKMRGGWFGISSSSLMLVDRKRLRSGRNWMCRDGHRLVEDIWRLSLFNSEEKD